MPYKIMQDVVAKRRAEYPEYDFLSDYQVHSANLVSSTIHGKAQEQSLDASPVYVPFPTGSGKTVGAIWGITKVIEQHPDKRICFLTPYKTAVDQMYQALVKHLGSDKVGMYYSDAAFVDKAAELQKQITVIIGGRCVDHGSWFPVHGPRRDGRRTPGQVSYSEMLGFFCH